MDPRGPANPREREATRDAPECLLATLPSETDAGDRRSSAPPRLQGDRVRKELVMSRLFKGRVETPTIGRFEIVRPIGAGAMGVVYEARDPKLGRRVALKVLQSTETERSPRARARMLREAQAMAHVAHPNIVTVHDAGEVEGQVFLAMELVRGITLEHWMEAPDQRARPWREVVRVFVDAGRGLAAAHAAGIVHRDFKPGNVMVGEHGLVKVLDFGLARAPSAVATDELAATHDDDRPSLWSSTVALTRTGAILGTPAYMSPEQHRGELASASSDQFSFCVALYEALYAQHPFPCHSFAALHDAVLAGRVREPPRSRAVPSWVRRAVLRGLSTRPEERFPSMAALVSELDRGPSTLLIRAAGYAGALTTALGLAYAGYVYARPGTVEVLVTARGRPVPGAAVRVDETALASERGVARGAVPAGVHALEIDAPGYRPTSRAIRVARGDARLLEVELQREQGVFNLDVEPAGGLVTIDGVDHGSRLRNVAVDTGLHEVQVRREGFHDRRLRWDARADETREGFVSLVPSEIWSRGYVDFNTAAHAPGDIDGDGRGDILLERGYELIAIDARRDRELWRWSHDMRFASRLELEELDGDGVLDLITIHADGDTYAVEARSSAALDASGLPRSLWRVADESGGLVGKRPAAMIRLDISGDGVRDVITHPFADRRVVAIDALTGQRLWSSEALDPPALDLVLRESDGVELVVAVSARELLAMDARTGVTRWRQAHAAPARSEVYVLENRHDPSGSAIPRDELTWFYQLDDQFVIRRARVRDGEPLWRRAVATRHCTRAGIPSVLLQCRKDATLMLIGNDARARWRYESSARLPALLGWSQPGAAALASHARGAVRLSEDGREQHVFALDGPATAAATLDWDADGDDELVLATSRNTLWAFDERDALVGSTLVTIKPDRLISMGDTDEDGYPELMAMGDTGFALVQGSRARWIRRTQKGIRAAPVVGDYDGDGRRELAVAATLDNNEALHLFDLEGGARLLRSEHLGHDIIRPPARVPGPRGDELIFLDRPDLGVVRFDPARERVLASYPGPRGFGTPTVADLDGDGGDEVIVATWRGPASLWVLDAETLEPRWGVELHYGAWAQPLVARPPARPERPWIVLALLDGTVMVVDPETRETLWTRDFTRQLNESPTVADLDGDGALELLVPRALQHTRELVCLDLATGDEMWSRADAAAVGVRVLVGDLDGDGALEIAAPSQAAGLFMLARDGQVRWTYLPRPRAPQQPRASANPALADLDADGRQELLVAFEHAGLHVLDAATGALLWRLHTEGDETVEAEPVLVDVDEDGQLELVVADTGGALYLLNGTTRRPARGRSPRQ